MATRLRTLLLLATLTAGVAVSGCGGGGSNDHAGAQGSATATPTPAATGEASASPPPTRPQRTIQGRFVVGDHRLWLRCVGGGSPAIVYVHPYGEAPSDPAGQDALGLQARLRRSHRVCVYDRANVGRSGHVAGRQTGADAVSDLHALLASARVTGPYVLVGARFGALIADMYSATYPNSIVGMVFVDGRLPEDEDVADRFFPRRLRVHPGDWAASAERLDQLASYDEAARLEGDEPKVPLTYIGPKDLAIPPSLPVQRITAVIRDVQQTFVERFDPGRLVLLDSPRPLERSSPDRIVQEIDKVVEQAQAQAQKRAKQQQQQQQQQQDQQGDGG